VADVRFGIETDTYDAEGAVTAKADTSHVTVQLVEDAAAFFVGDIEQRPPAYSAIKLAGQPAYRRARAGEAIELAPRTVHIERITLLAFEHATARIEVVCGRGTYIRSLAHDLGRRLGCGAHLAALRRISSGGFTVDDACSPEDLVALAGDGRLEQALLAPDRAVERRHACIIGESHAADVRSGRSITLGTALRLEPPRICRAYDLDGRFLGVLEAEAADSWHPAKVLPPG
jgi:tRNA pseudouridine55 synthase